MIWENPDALWLLLALPGLLFGLWFLGWSTRREAVKLFGLDARGVRARLVEKYVLAGLFMACLVCALALPHVPARAVQTPTRAGQVAFLVDVSASMAAQTHLNALNRLERAKVIVSEAIRDLEALGEVRISLHGMSSVARSHVPFVGPEDYPFLLESVKRVLGINSVPGRGTSLGRPLLNVLDKFSGDEQAKLIVLVSDGEVFIGETPGIIEVERNWIEAALQKAAVQGVKVITVGVGETAGAKIPYTDQSGYIGEYAQLGGHDFVTYLDEDSLKEIAVRTGGRYYHESAQGELREFLQENLRITNRSGSESSRAFRPVAHWFILAALPLFTIFARRHMLT